MSRVEDLRKAARLAAILCLILVGAVMIWRFARSGEISGSDLMGGAICLVVYALARFFPEEKGRE